jgi:hypothetical protein
MLSIACVIQVRASHAPWMLIDRSSGRSLLGAYKFKPRTFVEVVGGGVGISGNAGK